MRKECFKTISMVFLLAFITVILSAIPARAFWYGDSPEFLLDAPGDPQAVHEALTDSYLPGVLFKLFVHDTVAKEEEGHVTIHSKKAWKGYTLLSTMTGLCGDDEDQEIYGSGEGKIPCPGPPAEIVYNTLLIDMDGNLVKKWPLVGGPAEMYPGGSLVGGNLWFDPFIPVAGGGMPALVEMNWDGDATVPLWLGLPGKPGGAIVHHDHQKKNYHVYYSPSNKLPEGDKTLVLSMHKPGVEACPDTSGISGWPLQDDAIYEVDNETGEVWAWYPCEHFDQMGFDEVAQDAIYFVRPSPFGVGLGTEGPPFDGRTSDWQHINAVSYPGPNKWYAKGDERFHPDNILWDSRTNNMIAIIARHDGEDWSSGDIVWRVGPQYSKNGAEKEIGQIIGPHNAHMIPPGLPGAGNILVYDNGGAAGYGALLPGLPGTYPNTLRDYSRVVEFDPVTLEKVWEYKNPEDKITEEGVHERKFYSALISNAQRLSNGNTLICEGIPGRVFEVTRKGEIVWEYINPYYNGPTFGPGSVLGRAVYRATRVPYCWAPKEDNHKKPQKWHKKYKKYKKYKK